ncbi:MAG: guanylate kinase [Rhodobacteraceae bacterium]|nr:guanylate kinase [Paracoccaceae bacterium]
MRRGLVIILSSPSGAGKSTLSDRLRSWDKDIVFSVSATTREPREGEKDGREYFFKPIEKFLKMINNNEMLEHAEVFGNLYGSPLGPVSKAIESGQDVLFDIDWQGGQQIRNSTLGKHALSIFILPPSIAELERRLKSRGKDNEDVIKKRMAMARDEISHWPEYDYVLINNDLSKTENCLKTIIKAERLKLTQQPQIVNDVRNLNKEFENR